MRISTVTLVLVLGLTAVVATRKASAKGVANQSPLKLLKAHLIYDDDGTVDTRDVTVGKLALWNTPLGEGDAGRPSSSLLVLVGIPQRPTGKKPTAKLTLRVREKSTKRSLHNETISIGSTTGAVVPFLVRGTGCEALELEAVVDSGSPLVRAVAFNCGE